MTGRAAVFLDRDGVLNRTAEGDGVPRPPRSLDELVILPGVPHSCRALHDAGYLLVCVTNQPDIARGTLDAGAVAAMNARLGEALGLDAVLVCAHDDADGCDCRKPQPGMLTRAARELGIDLASSFMVGDRWRDVEAGRQAGCRTILVDHGYSERPARDPDHVVAGLEEAAAWILRSAARHGASPHGELIVNDPSDLRVDIFADGAAKDGICELAKLPYIKGFTTNPTLMRAAGVADYEAFAREILEAVPAHPISFEVFADEFDEIERQALLISSWGENVFVKIPVTDTKGNRSADVINRLAEQGVKLNVTALMTAEQVEWVSDSLAGGPDSFISVFAGRIADTGRDPLPIMRESLEIMASRPAQRLIWASPRELLNVVQANDIGCHVITVTHDLLRKLSSLGKDLDLFSLETVQMFHRDAAAAGYRL